MLALLTLGATAPAPTVRHLEYSFTDYLSAGGNGGQGTLAVDIMGGAPDGALVVQTKETWVRPFDALPQPLLECEVSIGGTLSCVQPPYGLSDEQEALLPLLAPDFFGGDGTRSRRYDIHDGVRNAPEHSLVVAQLSQAAGADQTHIQFTLDGMQSDLSGSVESERFSTATAITYDATRSVPTMVRVDWETARAGSAYDQGRIELHLTKDSAAATRH